MHHITCSVVDSLDPLAARIVATSKHTVVIEYEGARERMPRYVRDMLALAAYAQGQGVDVVGRFAPDLSKPDYYDPPWWVQETTVDQMEIERRNEWLVSVL